MIVEIVHALYWVGAVIAVGGIAFYFKRHPGAVKSAQDEWKAIHAKLDALLGKADAIHAVALAPVSVALVPVAPSAPQPAPQPAPAPVPAPNVTDLLFGGPPQADAPAPPAAAAPGWAPAPVMSFVDCTGQNIPLNPSTTYTINDCPAATMVATNITTLPCDPYILTVNGVGTPHPVQTGQCTVYASGATVVVSVAPMTSGGAVNLILQIHAA